MNVGERRRRDIFKILAYAVIVILTLTAQRMLPSLGAWRVKPQLLIPLAAMIAFFEGSRTGGAFGAVCGMLCDWLSVHTVSYYTVMLMLFGAALGMLIEYSMRRNILSAFFVSIITLVPVQAVFFTLFIWLPGRSGPYALVTVTTPEILYSLAFTPLIYITVKVVRERFGNSALR